MKNPKRLYDVRVLITETVAPEYCPPWANKGDILDGRLDKSGNFTVDNLIIYPSHFKILGHFIYKSL